jgi:hypothetical protein
VLQIIREAMKVSFQGKKQFFLPLFILKLSFEMQYVK